MSDLTERLLACIAEDEAVARDAAETWDSDRDGGWFNGLWDETGAHVRRNDPAHVLAVCKAHRAIVELHDSVHECPSVTSTIVFDPELRDGNYGGPCDTLRALATIYADRPGWREEWAS